MIITLVYKKFLLSSFIFYGDIPQKRELSSLISIFKRESIRKGGVVFFLLH